MASSSRTACFQCRDSTSNPAQFRNGWRLRSGEFARLCLRCVSAYEEGRFCETFHSNDDGWRDCESCRKPVHCGCIVSFGTHLLSDSGGINCMRCSRFNFLLARNQCLSISPEIRARETSRRVFADSQYCREAIDLGIQPVSRNPKSVVIPLFEKVLSASDADLKLARLILPKPYAEALLPDISGSPGSRIKIQDTEGNEWVFYYRCWPNDGCKTYVLEGLRDYMVSKNWQPGDTVAFYKVEPGAKTVIGLRKTSG